MSTAPTGSSPATLDVVVSNQRSVVTEVCPQCQTPADPGPVNNPHLSICASPLVCAVQEVAHRSDNSFREPALAAELIDHDDPHLGFPAIAGRSQTPHCCRGSASVICSGTDRYRLPIRSPQRPVTCSMDLSDYADIPLQPRPAGLLAPLTTRQLEVWNTSMSRRLNGWRRCAASLRIRGALDISILRTSLEIVIQRHESLRTRLVLLDGVPMQQVDLVGRRDIEVVQVHEIAPDQVEATARSIAQEFALKKVSLAAGPLCDVLVLRLSELEHVLLLVLDHMVSDVMSWQIVTREIWTAYAQAAQRLPLSLPLLTVQFADYAAWQQHIYGRWLDRHEAYWREHLAGVQALQVPLDRQMALTEHPATKMLWFSLGVKLSSQLRAAAQHTGIQPALVVMTLYVAAMSRWCAREDMIFTIAAHGRYRPELKSMVGYLATLPHLRVEVRRNASMRDLLERVVAEFRCAFHQHWDFDRVPHLIPECATELNFNWVPTSSSYRFLPTNWAYNISNSSAMVQAPGCPLEIEPFPLIALWWHKFMPFFFDNGGIDINIAIAHQPDFISAATVAKFIEDLRFFAAELLRCMDLGVLQRPATDRKRSSRSG